MTFSSKHTDHSNAPIFALHSSASNSGQWDQLKTDLEGRFEVHAFDLPGCGRTPLARDISATGAARSAIPVIREIEELGRSVHLVGHSNGGGIAIKVAMMRPDLVKSLTIYEPATFHFLQDGDERDNRLFREIADISESLSIAAAEEKPQVGMQRFLDFWNGRGFWNRLAASARQKFAGAITATIADFADGFAETWTLEDLSTLEIPALIMTGLDSPELTQRVSVVVAKAMPKARIALLPELGHMAPILQPEWVNSRIFEHVASVERPAAFGSWPSQVAA